MNLVFENLGIWLSLYFYREDCFLNSESHLIELLFLELPEYHNHPLPRVRKYSMWRSLGWSKSTTSRFFLGSTETVFSLFISNAFYGSRERYCFRRWGFLSVTVCNKSGPFPVKRLMSGEIWNREWLPSLFSFVVIVPVSKMFYQTLSMSTLSFYHHPLSPRYEDLLWTFPVSRFPVWDFTTLK